jgi:hypothetical protein
MSDHSLDALFAPLEVALDLSDFALSRERQSVCRTRTAPAVPVTGVSLSLDTPSNDHEVQPKQKATLALRMTATEPPTLPSFLTHKQIRPAALPDRKRKICQLYKQGKCHFGMSCRDLHEPIAPRVADARARQPLQRNTLPLPIANIAPEARNFDRKRKRFNPNDRDVLTQRAPVSYSRSNAFLSPYRHPHRAPAAAFPAAPVAVRGNPAIKSYTTGAQRLPRDSFVQGRQDRATVEAQHTRLDGRSAGREHDRKESHREIMRTQRMKATHARRKEEKVGTGRLDYGDEV